LNPSGGAVAAILVDASLSCSLFLLSSVFLSAIHSLSSLSSLFFLLFLFILLSLLSLFSLLSSLLSLSSSSFSHSSLFTLLRQFLIPPVAPLGLSQLWPLRTEEAVDDLKATQGEHIGEVAPVAR